MRTIYDIEIKNNNILLLVDYNIIDLDQQPFKITQTYKTIDFIISRNPRTLMILTHLGRPKNQDIDTSFIFRYLKEKYPVEYLKIRNIEKLQPGMFFLDNLRHYSNDTLKTFYEKFNYVVNDAFGSSHRKLDTKCYAGLLMMEEIENLKKASSCDLLIIGGAKISDKLEILKKFDCKIFLAGCLATSVLKYSGLEVGESKYEEFDCSFLFEKEKSGSSKIQISAEQNKYATNKDQLDCSSTKERANPGKKLFQNSKLLDRIILPVDFKVLDAKTPITRNLCDINKNDYIIDIGEKSIEILKGLIEEANVIIWNGPVGKFENSTATATKMVVEELGLLKEKEIFVGGGETLTCIFKYSSIDDFKYLSTGGGAMLSYLADERMPGIESLYD